MTGKVLWYDRRDGRGIITDDVGNEYYVSSDVITNAGYLDAGDAVEFEINTAIVGTLCAHQVVYFPKMIECPQCGEPNDPDDFNVESNECNECHDNSGLEYGECGCERCTDRLVSRADFGSDD